MTKLDTLARNATNSFEDKEKFHKAGKSILKKFAQELGLEKDDYEIRSNKAGMAVSGEITFHCDFLYIQLSEPSGTSGVLFRACNGRRDYSGGSNNFTGFKTIENYQEMALYFKNNPNFFKSVKPENRVKYDHLCLSSDMEKKMVTDTSPVIENRRTNKL